MPQFTRDPIFQTIPVSTLLEISTCLGNWGASFGMLSSEEKVRWLDTHRNELEDEICRVGSWTGGLTCYEEIVRNLAKTLKVNYPRDASAQVVERFILARVWTEITSEMNQEQRGKLQTVANELARKHGKRYVPEIAGVATLSAAQLSGFGVYLLGSTILGALNGALGLGLSFGAFTGLSSLIATVISPVGFGLVGVSFLVKALSPNYKKIIPVVLLIAVSRIELKQSSGPIRLQTIVMIIVGIALILLLSITILSMP